MTSRASRVWTRASVFFAAVAIVASVWTVLNPSIAVLAVVCCSGAAIAASKAQHRAVEALTQVETQLACLREAVRERSLGREEQRRFTHRLLSSTPGAVRICFPAFDGEAAKFAASLQGMFRDARWSVDCVAVAADQIPPGIGIAEQKTGDRFSSRFTAVKDAFEECGMRPSLGTFGADAGSALHVLVGSKRLAREATRTPMAIDSLAA